MGQLLGDKMRRLKAILSLVLGLVPVGVMAQGPPADSISSATVARIITPANGVTFPLGPTRMLFVGATACNLSMILSGDTAAVLFTGAAGILQVRVKDIEALNTTCTTIVGLW
jgi:hypothetical protein